MGTPLSTWLTYQSAWADVSNDERGHLVDESVAPSCCYTDPSSVSHGHEELIDKMQATQRNFPGATFRNDVFRHHHGQAVASWTMHDSTGKSISVGASHARFGDDGRLTDMTGFFGPVD